MPLLEPISPYDIDTPTSSVVESTGERIPATVANASRSSPKDLVEVLEEPRQPVVLVPDPEPTSLGWDLDVQPPEVIISSIDKRRFQCSRHGSTGGSG
ncbi:hypothetical protein PAMP_001366 [Pampus punctatissimus]